MASEIDKGDRELEIFRRFVKLSGLPIDPQSITKQLPPKADLLCRHLTEGPIAFELVEVCDPTIAKVMAAPVENGIVFSTSDPSGNIIRKKIRKTYEANCPVELLCYTDGRLITPDDVIVPTVRPILESWNGVFQRAWLLGETGAYALWGAS